MTIINSIDQETFRALLESDGNLEIGLGQEVEWFADRDETMIGTVGAGEQDLGWGCAVLKRGPNGRFCMSVRQQHFPTRHTAEMELFHYLLGADVADPHKQASSSN